MTRRTAIVAAVCLLSTLASGAFAEGLVPRAAGASGTFDVGLDTQLRRAIAGQLNVFLNEQFRANLPVPPPSEGRYAFVAKLDRPLDGRMKGTVELTAFFTGGGSQIVAKEKVRARKKSPHVIAVDGKLPWRSDIGAVVATFTFRGKNTLRELGATPDVDPDPNAEGEEGEDRLAQICLQARVVGANVITEQLFDCFLDY